MNDSHADDEEEEGTMKTLIILGSRNPEGQTATAADAMRAGLESAGGEIGRAHV